MAQLLATMHTLGLRLRDRIDAASKDRESGLTTVEIVLWVGFLVLLAGVVYAFLSGYISGKLGSIT